MDNIIDLRYTTSLDLFPNDLLARALSRFLTI